MNNVRKLGVTIVALILVVSACTIFAATGGDVTSPFSGNKIEYTEKAIVCSNQVIGDYTDYLGDQLVPDDNGEMEYNAEDGEMTASSMLIICHDEYPKYKFGASKGSDGGRVIKEDPSVWYFSEWSYPDGTWRRSGRTMSVSVQVWLSEQYNPDEWES